MSKQSYIRGFCKAAEAYGVDPQALAKFAAGEFAGAVPTQGAVVVGKNNIPKVYPDHPDVHNALFWGKDTNSEDANYAKATNDLIGQHPNNIAALEMGTIDPKYWAAHTTAVDRVTAPWRKAVKSYEKLYPSGTARLPDLPKALRDAMIRNYHNEMASLTGTPTRVSAQVKK